MAETISIAGHRVNKWVAFGGIGAVVVGGALYLRRKNSAASPAPGSAASATDPVTGLPYSEDNQIDPATGMTYLAEAQQYGSVASAEASVGAGYGGVSGTTSGYSGDGYGYPTIGGSATSTSAQFATNADWAQEVIAQLPSVTGDSQSDVATAVASYLAGLPLTTAQANDISVALAEFGPPPTGSFSIITQGSGSGPTQTGGGGTGTGTGTSPGRLSAPSGVHLTVNGQSGVRLQWSPVSGATSYTAQCKLGGDNGTTVNGPFTTTQAEANFGNLKPRTRYTALIWPGDSADPGGPGSRQPHAEYSFTTT